MVLPIPRSVSTITIGGSGLPSGACDPPLLSFFFNIDLIINLSGLINRSLAMTIAQGTISQILHQRFNHCKILSIQLKFDTSQLDQVLDLYSQTWAAQQNPKPIDHEEKNRDISVLIQKMYTIFSFKHYCPPKSSFCGLELSDSASGGSLNDK
jgi:hypothetical protein